MLAGLCGQVREGLNSGEDGACYTIHCLQRTSMQEWGACNWHGFNQAV